MPATIRARRGDEREEPKEPPSAYCRVRVVGGIAVIDKILDDYRRRLYEYNSMIRATGYYLKPVHKAYKTLSGGARRVYEYYGAYWWKLVKTRNGLRYVYIGKAKPPFLPDPPRSPLEGLSLMRENGDVIIECRVYDAFRSLFKNMMVVREDSPR